MALELEVWQAPIVDSEGNIQPGAQVTVFNSDDTIATIYDDLNRTPRSNPFNVGSDALARFYAEPGRYRVQAQVGSDIAVYDDVDLSQKALRDDLADPESEVLIAGEPAKDVAALRDDLAEKKIGGIVYQLDSIKELATAPKIAGAQYSTRSFWAELNLGGGLFVWNPDRPKADHNVGTVIAPEAIAAWDGTPANLSVLRDWTGAGTGAFVRVAEGSDYLIEWFGASPDNDAETNKIALEMALATSRDITKSTKATGRTFLINGVSATHLNLKGISLKLADNSDADMFTCAGWMIIKDCVLDGNWANQTGSYSAVLRNNHPGKISVENNTIKNFEKIGVYVIIAVSNGGKQIVKNNVIHDCGEQGVHFDVLSNNIEIKDNIVYRIGRDRSGDPIGDQTGDGIYLEKTFDSIISGNIVRECYRDGITLEHNNGISSRNIVSNNNVDMTTSFTGSTSAACIWVEGTGSSFEGESALIYGNVLRGADKAACITSYATQRVAITSNDIDSSINVIVKNGFNALISNNSISGSYATGKISLRGIGSGNVVGTANVEGNTISGTGLAVHLLSDSGINLFGVSVRSNTSSSTNFVSLSGNFSRTSVEGNSFTGSGYFFSKTVGYLAQSSISNNILSGNDIILRGTEGSVGIEIQGNIRTGNILVYNNVNGVTFDTVNVKNNVSYGGIDARYVQNGLEISGNTIYDGTLRAAPSGGPVVVSDNKVYTRDSSNLGYIRVNFYGNVPASISGNEVVDLKSSVTLPYGISIDAGGGTTPNMIISNNNIRAVNASIQKANGALPQENNNYYY